MHDHCPIELCGLPFGFFGCWLDVLSSSIFLNSFFLFSIFLSPCIIFFQLGHSLALAYNRVAQSNSQPCASSRNSARERQAAFYWSRLGKAQPQLALLVFSLTCL
jgi:hypothetical protein